MFQVHIGIVNLVSLIMFFNDSAITILNNLRLNLNSYLFVFLVQIGALVIMSSTCKFSEFIMFHHSSHCQAHNDSAITILNLSMFN